MTSLSGVTKNRGDPPAKIIQKPNSWRIENAQGFNSYWFTHVLSVIIIIIIIICSSSSSSSKVAEIKVTLSQKCCRGTAQIT